ncbi:hypothetical protein [Sinomonas sp. RB5]
MTWIDDERSEIRGQLEEISDPWETVRRAYETGRRRQREAESKMDRLDPGSRLRGLGWREGPPDEGNVPEPLLVLWAAWVDLECEVNLALHNHQLEVRELHHLQQRLSELDRIGSSGMDPHLTAKLLSDGHL